MTLREIVPEEPPPARDPDGPDLDCPHCGGRGFVRHDVSVGHPDFGRAFPCACYAPALQRKRLVRLYGAAQVPPEFADRSFASFAARADADQDARALVEQWAATGEGSLYLYGAVGRGKTGLALAALRLRAELQAVPILYRFAPDLFDDLKRAFDRETGGLTSGEVFDVVRQTHLVLLDDVGKEHLTPWVRETMERLLDFRWRERLPTVFTSNQPPAALEARFGAALYSRVRAMCGPHVLELQGVDLRALPGEC